MLKLKINNEIYECTNHSDMICVIQNNVSYDIVNDEIEYIENLVKQDNNGEMNEALYDEYIGALEDEEYKEIVTNHLNRLGIKYKITGKSEVY